jgi:hypothetical protein
MVGYPRYFSANGGNDILKHPLYLKYNQLTIAQIAALDGNQGFKNLAVEMESIMVTNDNMGILWYLQNIYELGKLLGY